MKYFDFSGETGAMISAATRLGPQETCETCAFGKAGAATEPHNALKGQICALGGIPLYCHHAPDGFELNWHGSSADYFASMRNRRDMRICAGWKRETACAKRDGFFSGKYNVIRRAVAEWALESLLIFTSDSSDPGDKREANWHLGRAVRFLARKDVGRLRIPIRRRCV